jgi:hypothetical protein
MDKIDNNKLITLFLYSGIIFLLTSLLYSMYNDFLSENYFNIKKFNLKEKFTDSDIHEKLKYINVISNLQKKSVPKIQEEIIETFSQNIQEEEIIESFSQNIQEDEPVLQKSVIETSHFYPFSEDTNVDDEKYQKLM